MPRLILLLAVIGVIYFLLRRAQTMPPQKRRAEYIKLGLGIVLVATMFLAATGRLNWLGAAFTALLVFARQTPAAAPALVTDACQPARQERRRRPARLQPWRQSCCACSWTTIAALYRARCSRALSRDGGWRTWTGSNSSNFSSIAAARTPDSLQLLDSYLQQRFPGDASFGGQQQAGPGSGNTMGRAEALAVLGLKEGAAEEDIIAAHRKLIQKVHPDRGGNDYLAAQINLAKDLLLG